MIRSRPAAQEGILQHLAGQLRIPHDPKREREDQPPVARVQELEPSLLPELHPTQELDICRVRRTAASR